MKELQFRFPSPGNWAEFALTAVYPDGDGFTQSCQHTQDDIPTEHQAALVAVVGALVGMSAPWKAAQVYAHVEQIVSNIPEEGQEGPIETMEAVVLIVEAVDGKCGRRLFTSADYPEFIITDSAAVAFFNYFTTHTKTKS